MTIILKRVYDPQTDTDGFRVLADRLWPRGIQNEAFTPFCSELKKHKKITLLTASKVIDKSALPVLMQAVISYCPTDQTV